MTNEEKHEIFDEIHGQMLEIKFTHKMMKHAGKGNEYLPIAFETISTLRMLGIDFLIRGFIRKAEAETLLNEYIDFFEMAKKEDYFSEKNIKFIEGIIFNNRQTLEEAK